MIIVWVVVAIALDRLMLVITAHSYNGVFQAGYASLNLIAQRRADNLINRRVLVPALVYWIERLAPWLHKYRLPLLYEPIRIAAMAVALILADHAIGTTGTLFLAALWPVTFLFDYWDFPFEMIGFAAGLGGNMQVAMIAGGVHALARPFTAPLVGVIYALSTGDLVGGTLIEVCVGVGLVAGMVNAKGSPAAQKYDMLRQNIQDVRDLFENRPFYLSEIFMTLAFTALVVGVVVAGYAGPTWPVPLALVIVQWTMPRAAETRTLAGVLLWVGMWAGAAH